MAFKAVPRNNSSPDANNSSPTPFLLFATKCAFKTVTFFIPNSVSIDYTCSPSNDYPCVHHIASATYCYLMLTLIDPTMIPITFLRVKPLPEAIQYDAATIMLGGRQKACPKMVAIKYSNKLFELSNESCSLRSFTMRKVRSVQLMTPITTFEFQ
jgi:hypothetical protein